MWDLIVSVPDHCSSFYFVFFQNSSVGECPDIPNVRFDKFLERLDLIQLGVQLESKALGLQTIWKSSMMLSSTAYMNSIYQAGDFYAPNFEKLLLLACACTSVSKPRLFYDFCHFETVHVRVTTFHIWVPHGKIADLYFFLFQIIPLFGVKPLLKMRWNSC